MNDRICVLCTQTLLDAFAPFMYEFSCTLIECVFFSQSKKETSVLMILGHFADPEVCVDECYNVWGAPGPDPDEEH